MTDNEYIKLLENAVEWLAVVLDQADYTESACGLMEPVGAVLSNDVLTNAHDAVKAVYKVWADKGE